MGVEKTSFEPTGRNLRSSVLSAVVGDWWADGLAAEEDAADAGLTVRLMEVTGLCQGHKGRKNAMANQIGSDTGLNVDRMR